MTDEAVVALDGATGGGQLLRTALALSMVTGRPFRLTNVRGARPDPGLRPQHLAGIRAAAGACDASVSGVEEGSEELTFRPGRLEGGRVDVDVGTAGSVTLVFDVLLPAALALDDPMVVTATGGTDVKWSPTMAYYRRAKLRLLRRWGVLATVDRSRTGFYPAGGGEATLLLAPSSPPPLELTDRGTVVGARVFSTASADLDDADVPERQAASAVERLREADVPVLERTVSSVETASTGSAVAVALDYTETIAGFDALGERGKPSEEVGAETGEAVVAFHEGDGSDGRDDERGTDDRGRAAVDRSTADQLVVLLALTGGRVAIPEVTDHVRSGVDLVSEFGKRVVVEASDPPVLSSRQ